MINNGWLNGTCANSKIGSVSAFSRNDDMNILKKRKDKASESSIINIKIKK